jgi:transposase
MERSTGAFSIPKHMLATITRLGRTRRLGTSLDSSYPGAGRTRPTQLDEHFCGWNVFTRKKRGFCVGKTKRGKGTKLMVVASGEGIPLGVHVASASPHEIKLIETTLDETALPENHEGYLVADRAYDSDPLRDRLEDRGLELVCPHKINRRKPKRQDGRKVWRYRKRWIIERTIAWLQNFRRIVIRWDRKVLIYRAFVHVACIMILLNRF